MEKISWASNTKIEEVLHRVKEERNVIHAIKRRKFNSSGHMFFGTAFKHVIEEKIEGTGGQGRRSKELLDDMKERIRYWKLK